MEHKGQYEDGSFQSQKLPFVVQSKLVRDAYDGYGRLLLRAGTRVDGDLNLDRLKQGDVSFRAAKDFLDSQSSGQESDQAQRAPAKPSKPMQTMSARDFVQEFDRKAAIAESTKQNTLSGLISLLTEPGAGGILNPVRAQRAVAPLTGSIRGNPKSMLSLVHLKESEPSVFSHSVNVAITAVSLALFAQCDVETQDLATGALLHDIGKLQVPFSILNKPGALSKDEATIVQRHPLYGARTLVQSGGYSNQAMSIVLDHHEAMDGQGYPRRKSGSDIGILARITSIADVYDALTTDKPYRKALSPKEALLVMTTKLSSSFDRQLLARFVEMLGHYPVGTTARLTNGYTVLVISNDKASANRPAVVQLLSDPSGRPVREPLLVDLRVHRHIGIASEGELTPDRVDPVIFREYRPFSAVA